MVKKQSTIDKKRRDLIKMLSLTGAAGALAVAQGALSPVVSASTIKAASAKTITKTRALQGLKLSTYSNAVVSELGPSKAELRFPSDGMGYLRPGRTEFKDEDDLAGYL